MCKADTGASSNYITKQDGHILEEVVEVKNGPIVKLPNNAQIQADKKGLLPLASILSEKSRTAHVFKGLTNASLISIGRLCDDGCVAVFDKRDLRVFKRYKLVLKGQRNFTDGLWDITFDPTLQQNDKEQSPPQQKLNMIVRKDQTKQKLGEYLHKCAFSPSVSTFLRAI